MLYLNSGLGYNLLCYATQSQSPTWRRIHSTATGRALILIETGRLLTVGQYSIKGVLKKMIKIMLMVMRTNTKATMEEGGTSSGTWKCMLRLIQIQIQIQMQIQIQILKLIQRQWCSQKLEEGGAIACSSTCKWPKHLPSPLPVHPYFPESYEFDKWSVMMFSYVQLQSDVKSQKSKVKVLSYRKGLHAVPVAPATGQSTCLPPFLSIRISLETMNLTICGQWWCSEYSIQHFGLITSEYWTQDCPSIPHLKELRWHLHCSEQGQAGT